MLTMVFAVLIGAVLGMLGGGGSILTVPVLTYIAGLDPKVAIASSLPVVALTSAFGAFGHWRAGQVRLRVAFIFGAFTMLGGYFGALSAQLISGETQLLIFAVVMLAASASLFRKLGPTPQFPADEPYVLPLARLAPLGIGVGLLTGIVGVGGGFLIVPALVQLGHVPIRAAIGTSLLVIALNATAGTLGYIGQVEFPMGLLVPFTALALVGIAIGTGAVKRIQPSALRRSFATLLLLVAAGILFQNRVLITNGVRSLFAPADIKPTVSVPSAVHHTREG